MQSIVRRILSRVALVVVATSSLSACSGNGGGTGVNPDASASAGGLIFSLSGATATAVVAALPAATSGVAAPVVSVDGLPGVTQARTITVSATEPFTTVYVQPTGSASYVRVTLPSATTLIGIRVLADAQSSFVATSASVVVANGSRTSGASTLTFIRLGS